MKLRYKFFAAFLVTSFLIVFLLVGIMQVFVNRNFAEFVNQQELETLNDLVSSLAEEYRQYEGWENVRGNQWRWKNILDESFPHLENTRVRQPPPPPRQRKARQMGPPNRRSRGNLHPEQIPPHLRPPGPAPPEELDPLNVKLRLNLFDKEKKHIVGPRHPDDKFLYREIILNGEVIGWIGLKVPDQMVNPLGINFLAAQKKTVYLLGLGILILAACISYLLSKQLITPIQELMKGTRAMAAFKFDTEINVRSKDELGKLAKDFNHMAQTLRRYEEMRKNWISDISHELRTPISILKGKIEALQDGIRQMTPDTLDSLHKDVNRLGKLVEDLHFLSLSDSENLHVKKKRLNPLALLKETMNAFHIKLEKQSITVHADLSIDPGLTIVANKDRMTLLFSNLIENTIRYTDSPGTLKISHEINPKWFTLHYEDSSPGVPEEGLRLIFNRLYRVDQSRSREFGGSGLGLSICKQIVENHKGTILSGHSDLGGLKITIRLPVG